MLRCKFHDFKDQPQDVRKVLSENSHLAECFQYEGLKKDIPFMKFVTDDYPRAEYQGRKNKCVSTIHHGQRKLLMTEIDFLVEYGHLSDTVLYIGSASGFHINYLLELFDHKFILVDPAPLGWKIQPSDRVEIITSLFTDDMIDRYKDKNILLISDIRSFEEGTENGSDEMLRKVEFDMELQRKWVMEINPSAFMLKFRLPWDKESIEYLDGDILIQPWTPPRSTETRLVAQAPYTVKHYDCKVYEEQMAYFSRIARIAFYDHPHIKKLKSLGYDHCFDCRSEIETCTQYLRYLLGRDPIYSELYDMLKRIDSATSEKRVLKKLYT